MKTTEEIIEAYSAWTLAPTTDEERAIIALYSREFLAGYRTAETEYSEAIRELVEELEEARDDVLECLNNDMQKHIYYRKGVVEYRQAQLARIDALLAKYKEHNHEKPI